MNLTQRQLQRCIAKWRNILRIDPIFDIRATIHRTPKTMPKGHQDSQACIAVEVGYHFAELDVNKTMIDASELDGVILHELAHIIFAPLQEHLSAGHTYLIEATIERLLPCLLGLDG